MLDKKSIEWTKRLSKSIIPYKLKEYIEDPEDLKQTAKAASEFLDSCLDQPIDELNRTYKDKMQKPITNTDEKTAT